MAPPRSALLLIGLLLATAPAWSGGAEPGTNEPAPARELDRSGRSQVGEASFYAPRFAGRPMADGTPMDPQGDNAASKTLPLGTTARVTNLDTGRSAVVTIQDRGPFVDGRIVDLSPATAEQIGLGREEGVTRVEVAPIAVPQRDGSIRRGEGSRR
ncbi:septal ring lytic transglycosylase RlpA family protein [Ramlibacter sp.]|uniref:septal ring lytic transglycosylase RlpA family protein n=1 Tax=Ramlibacter sp. TaxID=1917967 RepID=UPI002D6D7A2A|nr:septal ring lytic transglycosylase RlpA family protein [Ramlibacter sp.]HYD77118.1 septal ring lytic transglycosylase RlpA family protein [Ramlibacter sp.]